MKHREQQPTFDIHKMEEPFSGLINIWIDFLYSLKLDIQWNIYYIYLYVTKERE